jgi:hypothetical protein
MPRKQKGRKPVKKIDEPLFYIIGVGDQRDWEAGRGSLYYIEDKNGEKCVPVFTTVEGVEGYIAANFDLPEAHMDMMESMPESHIRPLTEGRFIIIPLPSEQVIGAAGMVGADYLVRDPRPGSEQEIMRLDGLYKDDG